MGSSRSSSNEQPTGPELIASPKKVKEVAKHLQDQSMIALDTEFIREKTFFPRLELIQIATEAEQWVFDVPALKKKGLEPLLGILQSRECLKIGHALGGDQECLFSCFDILAEPVFDTSMGAALSGYGENIGLGSLLKKALNRQVKKGQARSNWSLRPLPEHLLHYAALDVKHLIELAEKLMSELKARDRYQWVLEESAKLSDPFLYQSDPDEIAARLAKGSHMDSSTFGVLLRLVHWREKRIRELDIPRKWLATDKLLMDLARVKPTTMAQLKAFRALKRSEVKTSGSALLKEVEKGKAEPQEPPRSGGKKKQKGNNEDQEVSEEDEKDILEFLRCYVKYLANYHEIVPSYLVPSSLMLPIIRAQPRSPDDLLEKGLLKRYAAELVGQAIVDLLQGKKALTLENGKLKAIGVSNRESTRGQDSNNGADEKT